MKRRILLVDDEVAVLLTLKAVLEISGFDVDTATSAREGKSRIKHREYEMVITDMRMEDEHAGQEVIAAAKDAPYSPAIALLTAFPVEDDALMGADKMLVKPMHTRVLLQQLESLFTRHTAAREKAAGKKAAAANADSGSTANKSTVKAPSATKKSAQKQAGSATKAVAAAKKTTAPGRSAAPKKTAATKAAKNAPAKFAKKASR